MAKGRRSDEWSWIHRYRTRTGRKQYSTPAAMYYNIRVSQMMSGARLCTYAYCTGRRL